ncbi:MAG: thioredoxin family protein [Rhodobacteraceae bacterium]|nr:thioredoxin family protein [Paracoccaceae bacterium]
MSAQPPVCDFGWQAAAFSLPATDGKTYSLAELSGEKGLVLMFICNHCPYVVAIADKLAREGAALQKLGFGVAAICANDATEYPADNFENMSIFATKNGFRFPYLHDESQSVAKAYGAECTPEFFGFNGDLTLQYHGRLDASGRSASPEGEPRELYEAMRVVAETGAGPAVQVASIGCSIKWKTA